MNKKIAIILINYKTYADRFLQEAYASLMTLNYPKECYRIYIADNVTTPQTQQRLKDLAPEAVIVPTDGNGWGHGNNICAKKAQEDGFDDFLVIANMDTIFDSNFLKEMVDVAQSDEGIGIVQSKLLLHPPKNGQYFLNSKGNMLTFLGFGYCAGDGKTDDVLDEVVDITSAAGAGILISGKLFRNVGMCDESYFMYHDDIELSYKVKIAGYRLVLAPRSVIYHKHEFGRSIRQIYYMERNRFRFLLEFYKVPTLILIAPALLIMEIGMLPYTVLNRWFFTKLKVYGYFLNPRNWKEIGSKRKSVQNIRVVTDKVLLEKVVAHIDFQQVQNPLLTYIANPLFTLYWRIIKPLIRW